jgi:hypothetical protein
MSIGEPAFILLITTVPETHLRPVLDAMGEAGAGRIGNYSHAAFYAPGTGQFLPGEGANPAVGTPGELEQVAEYRIEAMCPRDRVGAICRALRAAHPYETPVIYLLPLLDEAAFR